jgi:hypothetical protein
MEAGKIAAQGDIDDGVAHIEAIRKKLLDATTDKGPESQIVPDPLLTLAPEQITLREGDNSVNNAPVENSPLPRATTRRKIAGTKAEPIWSQVSTRSKAQEGGNQQFHFDMPAKLYSHILAYEKLLLENKGLTLFRVALIGAAIDSFNVAGTDLTKWMFDDKNFKEETQPFSSYITKDQMLKIKKVKLEMRAEGQSSITIKEIVCAALNKFLKEAYEELANPTDNSRGI